jgi:CRP/FNR family transcriptional regulator, anaerobic regulatory protein
MYTFDDFINKCNTIYPLNEATAQRLTSIFTIHTINKHTIILQQNKLCNDMYFILKGIIRSYTIIDGNEVTCRLLSEGNFVTSYASYYKREASNEFLECYEDSIIAKATYQDIQQLYLDFPEFNYTARVFTEQAFYQADEQAIALRKTSAEMRVQHFLDKNLNLLNRVASRHIASFLGMTEETFSRIKSKLFHQKSI